MKGVLGKIQATVVKGVFLLVPLMVFGMLVAKALGMLRRVVEPFVGPTPSLAGVPTAMLIAVLALFLLCFLAGLAAGTRWAGSIIRWMESTVLMRLPGYAYMKGMGETVAGVQGGSVYEPVLARIEDSWQLGFIVETIEPGQYAVYVPGAPSPWSGAVYFMAEDRIKRVDMRIGDVQGCMKRLGIGSSELLRGKLAFGPASGAD